jgi:hypothetical protein
LTSLDQSQVNARKAQRSKLVRARLINSSPRPFITACSAQSPKPLTCAGLIVGGIASSYDIGQRRSVTREHVRDPYFEVSGILDANGCTPSHPLAACRGVIRREELARHVQLVLTDRSDLSHGREFGVMSPSTWRLADLFAKHAFLVSGLGWGRMPLHTVGRNIAEGRQVGG